MTVEQLGLEVVLQQSSDLLPRGATEHQSLLKLTVLHTTRGLCQELAHESLRSKSSPWPVFVNKVFCEHCCAHVFADHLWLPLCYIGRVEYFGLQSLKYLLFGPLQNKSVGPWLMR